MRNDVVNQARVDSRHIAQFVDDRHALLFGLGQTILVIDPEPTLYRRQRSHHLLTVNLMRTSNAADAPRFISHERVSADRVDNLFGTKGESRRLRCAHVLRRDALEVCAHADILAEVLKRVDLAGSIHRYIDTGILANLDDFLQRHDIRVSRRLLHHRHVYGTRLVGDSGADVVSGRAIVIACIHQLRPCQLQATVIPVALAALNYDLVLHSGGIWQLLYKVVVRSCHVGRGCERQS